MAQQQTLERQLSQFSPEAQAEAFRLVDRKLQGKMISFVGSPGGTQQAFIILSRNPQIKTQMSNVAEQKQLAQSRGFSSLEEARQLSGFAKGTYTKSEGLSVKTSTMATSAQDFESDRMRQFERARGILAARGLSPEQQAIILTSKKEFPGSTKEQRQEIRDYVISKGQQPRVSAQSVAKERLMIGVEATKTSQYTPSAFQKAKDWWVKTETKYAGKFLPPWQMKVAAEKVSLSLVTPKSVQVYSKTYFQSMSQYKQASLKEIGATFRGFEKGGYERVREKPLTTAAYAGVGVAAAFALPAVGAGSVAVIGTGATTFIGEGLGTVAGLYYGASVLKRVTEAPKKTEAAGAIFFGEVVPLGLGSLAGTYAAPRIKGYIRTIGREEIPLERAVARSVLKGKESFYSAPKSKHMQKFLTESKTVIGSKEPLVFHATGKQWWKSGEPFVIRYAGKSELPGLYGAPKVSLPFVRITGGGYKLYGGNILEPAIKPGVVGIAPKRFAYIGYKKVPGVPAKPHGYEFIGKTRPGVAYIPRMKTEVEAIYTIGTAAKPVSAEYYLSVKGIRFPLDIFKATGTPGRYAAEIPAGLLAGGGGKGSSIILPSSYVFTPTSVGIGAVGYALSSVISKPSTVSSSFVSIISTPSIPSLPSLPSIPSKPSTISYSYTPSSPSYVVPSPSPAPSPPSPSPISKITPSSYYYGAITKGKSPAYIPEETLGSTFVKPKKMAKSPFGKFTVSVRRFGQFKPIATTASLRQAFSIGKQRVGSTLAATFKVTGAKGLRTPSGFYSKATKQGTLFIERPRFRLSTLTERAEIKQYKRRKKRR